MTIEVPDQLAERLVKALERLAAAPGAAAPDPNTLLKYGDLQVRLNKSRREVQRLINSGALPKVPGLGSKTVRVRPADLAEFLKSPEQKEREKQVGRRRM